MKGAAVGGAELSSRHANFVITHPGATSDDVLELIEQVQTAVDQKMGVELQTQVEVW
jgi:UDP-N-acetylmuramate dehydrogenase